MHIYLDQNIIGEFYEGKLTLESTTEIQWVYSKEHFTEIARGEKVELLNVLKALKARQLEVMLDNFKITNQAYLHEYSDPFERYEQYLQTIDDVPFDSAPLMNLMARFLGGSNFEEASAVPDHMDKQMRIILDGLGPLGERLAQRWEIARDGLAHTIEEHLKAVQTLEETRQTIGTAKGRGGNFESMEDPILALWNLLAPNLPGMSIDQFFGFDPIDKQGYLEWPLFLGVVGCHSILNVLGYRPDKGLSKPTALPSILSDGSHIAHAAFCKALVSMDRRLCAKARAIYRHKGIQTEVMEISVGTA